MKRVHKILVVDDEPGVCKSVKKILSKEISIIEYALSAKEALGKLEKGTFDIVITDLMMPIMSGMELLEQIKKRWPDVSVIMITGYATIKTSVQAIQLGAFDYIPKPFTAAELRAVVVRALERKRLLGEGKLVRESVETPVEEKEIKKEKIESKKPTLKTEPKNIYCILEHSWAKEQDDGKVKIGMEDVFQKTVGDIVTVDLPMEDEELRQGEACARVIGMGIHIHKLWSPVGGRVIEINEKLERDAALANTDPYGEGWLILLEPSNLEEDLKNLTFIE